MIKISTLPNGIRVITDSDAKATSISMGIWVGVGSRYENEKNNGISHLLEHMAFKGTTTRSAFDISKEVEDVGGIINAYTGHNMTAYHVRVLKEHTHLGLDILTDIVQNSVMDKEELQKEKGVIIQEINMKNDTPDDLVFEHFYKTAFSNQPLGRSILGTAQTVQSISSEDLLKYVQNEYTAERMVVSASGAVDHDSFIAACLEKLSNVPQHPVNKAIPAVYKSGESRVQKKHEQINLVLGFEGFSYNHPDYYTATILASIAGGGMSSRLFQEIREKRGLVYSIYAFNSAEIDTGIFGIYAGTGENEVKELMPVLIDEILRLPDTLTEEEINRSKAQLKARVLMKAENIASRAESNAISMILRNRVISDEEIVERIEAVNHEQLQKIAHNLLMQKPTFAALGPIEHTMPYNEILNRLKS